MWRAASFIKSPRIHSPKHVSEPTPMRLLAFYLPQFHQIPENDAWWGEGFTEWVNVARATPLFSRHDHPRVPTELGEYALTDPAVHRAQTLLAQQHGVDAFCMYFYWFDGVRLLEKPIDAWQRDSTLLPYCLSWANEPWTRRWDGRNQDVLMPQSYPEDYIVGLFRDLLPHFRAPHYVRVDSKPVLVIHRADLIPDPMEFSDGLRRLAAAADLPGLYLVASETKPEIDSKKLGFDAVAEFPPVGVNRLRNAFLWPLAELHGEFRGRLLSYDRVARYFMKRNAPSFVRHRGVMPSWDNTARRGVKATVYVGHSPELYRRWLSLACSLEARDRGEHGLVFVNAWNEWAEGAYLEPDQTHGRLYLEATAAARRGVAEGVRPTDVSTTMPAGRWTLPHLHSLGLLAAGSVLARTRALRNRWMS
jgi:lipopolysaccharide biosynthesis protein